MPKSKREKKVTLSRVNPKGREGKDKLIEAVHLSFSQYKTAYVFQVDNFRNNLLRGMREEWRSSRFFLGKNKVMQAALGKSREEEHQDNTHKLTPYLSGNRGLLFTNDSEAEVKKRFASCVTPEFARAGGVATETVILPAGICEDFAHSMESYVREKLLLPTILDNGKVRLVSDYQVCKEGQVLTPDQCRILKLLKRKLARFEMSLICCWKDGEFKLM